MPGISSKLPAAIALSTAAQALAFDEELKACNSDPNTPAMPVNGVGTTGECA
jgi:hypothetical protein